MMVLHDCVRKKPLLSSDQQTSCVVYWSWWEEGVTGMDSLPTWLCRLRCRQGHTNTSETLMEAGVFVTKRLTNVERGVQVLVEEGVTGMDSMEGWATLLERLKTRRAANAMTEVRRMTVSLTPCTGCSSRRVELWWFGHVDLGFCLFLCCSSSVC